MTWRMMILAQLRENRSLATLMREMFVRTDPPRATLSHSLLLSLSLSLSLSGNTRSRRAGRRRIIEVGPPILSRLMQLRELAVIAAS